VKILLAVLIAIVPVKILHAEEVDFLCGSALYFVDTDANTIRNGRTGETDWRNMSFEKTVPQGENYPACRLNVSVYVRTSSQEIDFGFKEIYLNNCGSGDFRKGNVAETQVNTIDRITGLANLNGDNARCVKYDGKAF
jgi:hypothetical protein